MQSFFIFCSGADVDLIKQCSSGERSKYASIGATVFFTAVMAGIAGSYALYTVFDSAVIACFFGLLWGGLIFNLDRYIVSTLRESNQWWKEWLQAAPRIILAIIIAIVISKPLELKIFEKEIDQVLLEQKNELLLNDQQQVAALFDDDQAAFTKAIQELKQEIATKESQVDELYDIYIGEAEGTAGTQRLGKGPVYKEKRDKHDAALAELNELKERNGEKIVILENQIAANQTAQQKRINDNESIIQNFDGLMARIDALSALPFLPSFFIFLLFLAIETSPIFTKLISKKGEYDYRLLKQESLVKSSVELQLYQQNAMVQTDQQITDEVYEELTGDEETHQNKKHVARQILQKQNEEFFKNQSANWGIS